MPETLDTCTVFSLVAGSWAVRLRDVLQDRARSASRRTAEGSTLIPWCATGWLRQTASATSHHGRQAQTVAVVVVLAARMVDAILPTL